MEKVIASDLKKIYLPPKGSHKGQNGKLMIIGGSELFHGASLWALKVASRIVDMVFYCSISENNKIAQKLKSELYDFILVPRENLEEYIEESDCVLIGPGMVREDIKTLKHENIKTKIKKLEDLRKIKDEGKQTYFLTKYLLSKFPNKRWVIDAGSLQMMEKEWLKKLNGQAIITPHKKEFEKLFGFKLKNSFQSHNRPVTQEVVGEIAKKYSCTVLLKGPTDTVCSPKECKTVEGGNAGMTKGGTGDVLAGLAAALYCKNDAFLSVCAASYINKKAGEELFKKVGYFFNASDLCDQTPRTMKQLLL